ncbi:MAG TPA: hypothetical protein VNG89_14170, partial [Vicinamibacterales bacterium]|nr:hypothetical protein [Vicinamibacterales bacterium]
MHVRKQAVVLAAGLVCLSAIAVAQEAVDLAVVDRIKSEATANSQVMDLLREMTDVHGPRLTGSPGFEDAAKWAADRLTGFGIGNVHLERWGPFGRSWSAESASVEVLAPRYARLDATPLAWSAPTAGAITGEPLLAALEFGFFSPKKLADDFEAYRKKWSGKLRGRIVLFTQSKPLAARDNALFHRYTDAELADIAKAPDPAKAPRVTRIDDLPWPDRPEDVGKMFNALPEALVDALIDRYEELGKVRAKFFADEGAVAIL